MKPDVKQWEIPTSDGRLVRVEYKSHYFGEYRICPHLEFRGYAISETGYRSHFFGDIYSDKAPEIEEVHKLAQSLVKEWLLPPPQMGLF